MNESHVRYRSDSSKQISFYLKSIRCPYKDVWSSHFLVRGIFEWAVQIKVQEVRSRVPVPSVVQQGAVYSLQKKNNESLIVKQTHTNTQGTNVECVFWDQDDACWFRFDICELWWWKCDNDVMFLFVVCWMLYRNVFDSVSLLLLCVTGLYETNLKRKKIRNDLGPISWFLFFTYCT